MLSPFSVGILVFAAADCIDIVTGDARDGEGVAVSARLAVEVSIGNELEEEG